MATISRQQYNDLYGPTVGDKIRLGDTDLYVEITGWYGLGEYYDFRRGYVGFSHY